MESLKKKNPLEHWEENPAATHSWKFQSEGFVIKYAEQYAITSSIYSHV